MKTSNIKLQSDIYFVSWTEDREVTEEDLNIIVNQEAEDELKFFQKQKLGDVDRWDNTTPRLGICDEFKFWAGVVCQEKAIFFRGFVREPSKVKEFLDKKPKLLPKRPN